MGEQPAELSSGPARKIPRREFLQGVALVGAGLAAQACVPDKRRLIKKGASVSMKEKPK